MAASAVLAFVLLLLALSILRPTTPYRRNDLRASARAIAILSLSLIAHVAGNLPKNSGRSGWSLDDRMFLKGARIIDAWTSPSHTPPGVDLFAGEMRSPHVQQLVRHSRGPPSAPEIALGLYVDPRALWFFAGQNATLAVALPQPVLIESIRLRGHSIQYCLPRDVNVWGLVSLSTAYKVKPHKLNWPPIGFPAQLRTYPRFASSLLQHALSGRAPVWFPIALPRDVPRSHCDSDYAVDDAIIQHGIVVHAIALEFRRNWGSDYSCFAGLGIAGNVTWV